MRVLFVTRRAFPTISGMSVYGRNLVQHLVARGHDVTMLAQYRDDDGKSVYGSGPPVPEPHTEVVGIPSIGEVEGDFERDVEALIERMTAIAEEAPVDVIHAQYGYPPGAAAPSSRDGAVMTRAAIGTLERRIARVSRRCARLVLELRKEGDNAGAARLEAMAIETVEQMRRGAL